MIKLLIIDDHILVCTALTRLLSQEPSLTVLGAAHTGEEALELGQRLQPDIILLDMRLPDFHARELIPELKKRLPDCRIIILTIGTNDSLTTNLIQLGVSGFLLKSASIEETLEAIHVVSQGQTYIMSKMAQDFALLQTQPKSSPFDSLSKRERHIIKLVSCGYPAQFIAKQLEISIKTVSTFKRRAFKKLGIQRDSDLVLLAHNFEELGDEVFAE